MSSSAALRAVAASLLGLALSLAACGGSDRTSPSADAAIVPDGFPTGPDAAFAGTGEACDSPAELEFCDTITLDASMAGHTKEYDGPPACSVGDDEVDMVYKVHVAPGQTLEAIYTGADALGVDVVSVQKACPDTSLVGGCTVGQPDVGLDHSREFPDGGDAYVFVWADAGKAYTLQLTLTPPACEE